MKINNILEVNFGFKEHSQFRYLPYGFGYENALLIFGFLFFTIYWILPFKLNCPDNCTDIDYGINFFDDDQSHYFPDNIRIAFGKWTWSKNMVYRRVYFNKYYEIKTANNVFTKDISTLVRTMKSFKFEAKIRPIEDLNKIVNCYYYKEILVYKFKFFGKFINKCGKEYHRLEIEFSENIRNTKFESIYLPNSEKCEEAFERYCKENNLQKI